MNLTGKMLLSLPKPINVTLTDHIWDDGWGQKGMIAEIVSAEEDYGCIKLHLDYNKNKAHNLSLQSRDYRLAGGKTGTAFDCGYMDENNIAENYYVEYGETPLALVNEDSLLSRYLQSNTDIPYVQWLENLVVALESKSA